MASTRILAAMLAHIPPWVFAVLALLIGLGYMQSRPRQVRPSVIRGIALALLVYSLWGVTGSFGLHAPVVLAWVAGVGASAWLGRRVLAPRGMTVDASAQRVQVPGSWLPLGLLLGIFGLKFAVGFAAGTGAPVAANGLAASVIALLLGLFSGAFFARAQAVVAVARDTWGVKPSRL